VLAKRILALGGGGFPDAPDTLLEDHLLSLCRPGEPPGRVPRVCFVPTASGDAQAHIEAFLAANPPDRAQASVLRLVERDTDDLRDLVLRQDAVFVGGGSTANLLAVWRVHGLDAIMREAYDRGVVLAGISAGMNCWFEASTTDSFLVGTARPLTDGLGLLAGSACPHYHGEPARRPAYLALVASGFQPGYALDEGAAALFEDGKLIEVVTSVPGAGGFRVTARDGSAVEEPLPCRYLGG
jgi:peptidase E